MTNLEVSSAGTWFDTITWGHYARVQLEEVTIVCSNADACGCLFKVQDPDYDRMCPLCGRMNTKTIKRTFKQTNQYARMPNGTINGGR
jgi:hypothetical protein